MAKAVQVQVLSRAPLQKHPQTACFCGFRRRQEWKYMGNPVWGYGPFSSGERRRSVNTGPDFGSRGWSGVASSDKLLDR